MTPDTASPAPPPTIQVREQDLRDLERELRDLHDAACDDCPHGQTCAAGFVLQRIEQYRTSRPAEDLSWVDSHLEMDYEDRVSGTEDYYAEVEY